MSRPPRFFISPDQVNEQRITISGEDIRHIAQVLRMKTGDELLLCDGQGTEYTATIERINRDEIDAAILRSSKRQILSPRVTLCQGLPKADKMDWIVQKATELAISAVIPVITERTIVKVRDGEKRVARWQKIAREAAMQSDRPDIPTIHPIVSFRDLLLTCDPGSGSLKLLPWEEGTEPIRSILQQSTTAQEIMVLIGPEGGFSGAEAESARAKGFHAVSLGRNILRTETAAIAVLSIIGYEFF